MEKVRPLHHHNSSDLAQDMEMEMETNTNELEKIIIDLAHSIRMNGLVCKLLDFFWAKLLKVKWILLFSFTGVADDFGCIAIACLWN